MRDFLRSPLFRCLVCLILVCCILVSVSPIRTEAFSAGAAITAIIGTTSAVAAVASIFQCLGVMPDSSDTSVFEGVVNDCVDALTASGVLVNGMLSVLQLSDGVVVKNHVNQGIIEAIHDWLFASETVFPMDGYMDFNGTVLPVPSIMNTTIYPYCLLCWHPDLGSYCFYQSMTEPYWSGNAFLGTSASGGWMFSVLGYGSTSWSSSKISNSGAGALYWTSGALNSNYVPVWSNFDLLGYDNSLLLNLSEASVISLGVASGLVAGQIGTDIETDYKTWVDDGVIAVDFGIGYVDDPNTHEDDDNEDDEETGGEIATIPPDEIVDPNNPVQPTTQPSPWWQDNRWLNIGGGIVGWELGQLIRQLLTQTQTQTQTAVGDPQYMVDTSLFGNGGNGNNTIAPPDTGDPDSSTPTDPSVPDVPSDIAAYTFSLNDIFPFCIPFDLYDFLTCLDAAPVAPVIEWALQLPGGGTFPITLDLSPFDSVAQLLRRLELLIFCVGLALKTRDLIKG